MSNEFATAIPQKEARSLFRDADEVLERHALDPETASETLALPAVIAALSRPEAYELVRLLVHGLADGRPVCIEVGSPTRGEAGDYSPQVAADALGVSRKLVNKLIESGKVRYYTLPGSKYKRIPASEVERLIRERIAMRDGIDQIVDDLVDADAEY